LALYVAFAGFAILMLLKRTRIFISAFFHSQFMLLMGLKRIAISGKPMYIKQVEGTRKIGKEYTVKK